MEMMASGGGDLNVVGCLPGRRTVAGCWVLLARDRARITAPGGYIPEMTGLPLLP